MLANENPFDGLLGIKKGRHEGFPPQLPKHFLDVIDEPSISTTARKTNQRAACTSIFR